MVLKQKKQTAQRKFVSNSLVPHRFIQRRFVQHMGLLLLALIIAVFLSACATVDYKPDTLSELNYSVEYPHPNTPGLFSGDDGHFDLLNSKQPSRKHS